jgi:putative aldouronate transport system permease protein
MRLSRGERIFQVVNYVLLILITLVFIVPLITVVATSFVSQEEYARRGALILFPESPDIEAYKLLLARGSIVLHAYGITFLRVGVGTFLNLLLTTTLAFVLSRRELPGRVPLTFFVFFTMLFSGGLIPMFVLYDRLGLLNSFWAMITNNLVNPWYLLIMRTFFMQFPRELEEAAAIDGAGPARVLWQIVLPLSKPSIATIGLFYAVWHWNAWFDAAIFIRDWDKMPMQVILRGILTQGMIQDPNSPIEADILPPAPTLRAAMIVISTVPILLVYPFLQKYFVRGALVGSLKG